MDPALNVSTPNSDSVHAPESHGLRATKHSIPVTTCMRVRDPSSTSPSNTTLLASFFCQPVKTIFPVFGTPCRFVK